MPKQPYQRTRHINAKPDEWVHVNRPKPAAISGGGDLLLTIVLWVGGIILVLQILSILLPYIILGLVGLAVATAFTKR